MNNTFSNTDEYDRTQTLRRQIRTDVSYYNYNISISLLFINTVFMLWYSEWSVGLLNFF